MPAGCLLCYITDRTAFPGNESERRARLLEKIAEAARAGIDYIQLREKDLPPRELEIFAREALSAIRESRRLTRDRSPLNPALLINSRTEVAVAVGADGVHLRSDDVTPSDVRNIWDQCGGGALAREPVIGVSCHTPEEVSRAEQNGSNFAVFAPVFEKQNAPRHPPTGLAQLREACRAKIPILALGGVTLANARLCLEAGASGIAGIRLFQANNIAEVIRQLGSR